MSKDKLTYKTLPHIPKTVDFTPDQTDTCPVCCDILQGIMLPLPLQSDGRAKYRRCNKCMDKLFPFPYFVLEPDNHKPPLNIKLFSNTITIKNSIQSDQVMMITPTEFPILGAEKK